MNPPRSDDPGRAGPERSAGGRIPRENPPLPGPANSTRGAAVPAESEARQVRESLEEQCARLARANRSLALELEALRSDFSARKSELEVEIGAIGSVVDRGREEISRLERALDEAERDKRTLKSQNLALHYLLSFWGIPLRSGGGAGTMSTPPGSEDEWFFPAIVPLRAGEDPVPVALRGDMATIPLVEVLRFLLTARLSGVLTVAADDLVAKLYVEDSFLRLAGWNRRDRENREDREAPLLSVVRTSGRVSPEALDGLDDAPSHDLALATRLVGERGVPAEAVTSALGERSLGILGEILHLPKGSFCFQPGTVPMRRDLQLDLEIGKILDQVAVLVTTRQSTGEPSPCAYHEND